MVLAAGEATDSPNNHDQERLGPYEHWMMDVGKFYDLPGLMLDEGMTLSCLAEFRAPVGCDAFLTTSIARFGSSVRLVRLPTLHHGKMFKSRFIPFLLSSDPDDPSQQRLLESSGAEFGARLARTVANPGGPLGPDTRLRLNFPIRSETLNPDFEQVDLPWPAKDDALNGRPPRVIVAIIDLGIPFAHANFRHASGTGTRIDYCWAQSARADLTKTDDVLFGREFTRAQIDEMVLRHNGDEDAIYRAAEVLGSPGAPPAPLDRIHSHGAHVLDTLAGNWDPVTGAEVRIIAVDLPASSTWETSGFGKDMFVLSALHYIFDRANLIRQAYQTGPLPLVINLSYGYSGGPHDGSGLIEQAMAELVGERNTAPVEPAPTVIVMPSGNLFQDRLYAQITNAHFEPGHHGETLATLHWFAPPCDRTSSYIEFWYPPGLNPEQIRLRLTPPSGVPMPDFQGSGIRDFAASLDIGGSIVGQFTIDRHRRFIAASRVRVTVILAPTEAPANPDLQEKTGQLHAPAPAGLWTVQFILPPGVSLPSASPGIDCRIQRDTSYGQGNTGAQQSYFVDPLNARYDETGKLATRDLDDPAIKGRRFGSMNGMATSPGTLVVGGHVIRTEQATIYSSAGPSHSGAIAPAVFGRGVDISAPAERSACEPGIIAAGTRSGITVAFQGTSSSAPQVARQLATALMQNKAADVPGFLALLAADAAVKPVPDDDESPSGQRRLGRFILARP